MKEMNPSPEELLRIQMENVAKWRRAQAIRIKRNKQRVFLTRFNSVRDAMERQRV